MARRLATITLVTGPTIAVTLCYVFAYTLWNWIFVTDEFSPSVSLMHVGFLGAPILGCLCTLGLGAYRRLWHVAPLTGQYPFNRWLAPDQLQRLVRKRVLLAEIRAVRCLDA
jgi:hypothetical protein